ncbi:hypothetical protein [Pleionea sediminis]|uniref:hypothetical protein n=1 Tax=Pleionea sediminis TaxID=2569479 RepID=UPI00118574A7|nr:hypothetical protein [Pleionea sediminis]
MNWTVRLILTLSFSGLLYADEKSPPKETQDTLSLELLEYLAEFSKGDGTLVDPQTYEVIQPKAQVKCGNDSLDEEDSDSVLSALHVIMCHRAEDKVSSAQSEPDADEKNNGA